MSNLEDDFADLLNQADVKEDFMDLGFIVEDPKPPPVASRGQQVIKSEDDKHVGVISGKKFKVKVVKSGSGLCLNYIGSGASFCLRKNCSTNHASFVGAGGQSCFIPPSGGVLVILKNLHVAFSSPTLKLSLVEEDVVNTWEGMSNSLEVWQESFQASNQGEDVVMSIEDIKLEAKASRGFEAFQTPAKKKRVVISKPDSVFEEYELVFETIEDRSLFKKSATSATVAESVCEMDRSLNKLSKGVARMFLEGTLGSRGTEATADRSFRMAKGLEGLVGSSKEMEDSDWVCPTVWGTLATIGAEVTTIRDQKAILPPPPPAPDIGPFKAEVKDSQDKLAASMTKLGSFSRLFAKSMLARVSAAETEIKRLLLQVRSPPAADTFGDELDGLLAAAGGPPKRPPPAPSSLPAEDRLSDLEDKLDKVLASNEDLERRLARILAESEVDAVKFAGLGLRSVDEVAAWVAIHFPQRSYGLMIDAYLLFDLIADDGPATQKDLMTEMKRRMDLDIGTEAEGQALTAFLAEVPRLFHTSSTSLQTTGDNVSFFSKVPTHKVWAGSFGLKKMIEKRLAKLKTSLREVLATELELGSMAYIVAVEALSKTISWIGAFITYLDNTYEHLHVQVGFTSARAWALTTQLGYRIFSDLHSVRVGTMKSMGSKPESICPAILWSVFRTHDKMAGFEDANFENHPSIASEFVKFLATNTGIEGMAVLQEEVAALKSKLKDTEKQATLAFGKADKAASVADVAKKATETLSKQVDRLAAKVG
jgi:hypothetical protein